MSSRARNRPSWPQGTQMVWETEVSTKVGVHVRGALLCATRSLGQLSGAHIFLPIGEASVSACAGGWVPRC